jgi:hypothetical protein
VFCASPRKKKKEIKNQIKSLGAADLLFLLFLPL